MAIYVAYPHVTTPPREFHLKIGEHLLRPLAEDPSNCFNLIEAFEEISKRLRRHLGVTTDLDLRLIVYGWLLPLEPYLRIT